MKEMKKRRLYLALMVTTIVLLLSGAVYFIMRETNQKAMKKEIESYVELQQYKHESTKDWDNGIWLSTLNKEKVEQIKFISSWQDRATQSWMFDGLRCYYKDGVVSVVVGSNMKLTGSMSGAFAGLENLISIQGFEYIDTSEVKDMSYLFQNCKSLETIELSELEMNNVLTAEGMFKNCTNLKELDMSDNDLENATNLDQMFSGCKSLDLLVLPKVKNVKTMSRFLEKVGPMSEYKTEIQGFLNTSQLEDASYMFYKSCLYNYTVAEKMDTSSLINAKGMFAESAVSEINLSKWEVGKLETTEDMFWSDMFLIEIDMTGWSMQSLENCKNMFYLCTSMQDITLGWEDVPNIKRATGLFKYCFHTKTIDISCFEGVHLGDTREMFMNCEELTTIYGSNFEADVSDEMFFECFVLEGAKKYAKENIDIQMATVEGYFTEEKK